MFGDRAGIDFNTGEAVAIDYNNMYQREGCSAISDTNGNILLYTNGTSVFDRNGDKMPNGTHLTGHQSATQSALIVRKPNSYRYFYVFTVPDLIGNNYGLRYSIVDITLREGLGDVTNPKNNYLTGPTEQKVTGVIHKNKKSVWIITHVWNSDEFHTFLLTENNLIKTPVISKTGSVHIGPSNLTTGYLKVSPNGKKIALVTRINKSVELFDFDNETGIVSNPITFLPNYAFAYGIEFSPQGKYLYFSTYGPHSYLYQYDLTLNTANEIINSGVIIAQVNNQYFGALQVAPDQKIYVSKPDSINNGDPYLAVINNPDEKGASCEYEENGFFLNGNKCLWGLPNFIQSYFFKIQDFNTNKRCSGDSVYFSITNKYDLDSLLWNFDDPLSGNLNYSEEIEPFHIYNDGGKYRVKLISYFEYFSDTLIKEIEIFTKPVIDLGFDTGICSYDTITLIAGDKDEFNYNWQDGSQLNHYEVISPGEYSVIAYSIPECMDTDTIVVENYLTPPLNLGNDTLIYYGDSLILNAGNMMNSYFWQDGTTDQYYIVKNPGNYYVEIFNDQCHNSDSIIVDFISNCNIYTPSIFSPNNDGLNDSFHPLSDEQIDYYKMIIANRWGSILYETDNFDDGWDGKYQDELLPEGVYVYKITYSCMYSPETKLKQGTIMLIR